MQILTAQLDRLIDESEFRESWDAGRTHDAPPPVAFKFGAEGLVVIRIDSGPASEWNEANFKQTFAIAVSKVDSKCRVAWL